MEGHDYGRGFVTCKVTNTYIENAGANDALLTLVVSINGGIDSSTMEDFACTVEGGLGNRVPGPLI